MTGLWRYLVESHGEELGRLMYVKLTCPAPKRETSLIESECEGTDRG
jgi:hypothetical protein